MSNYVRNFGVKNYQNQTTIPQLIANNMSGCFFLKHGVHVVLNMFRIQICMRVGKVLRDTGQSRENRGYGMRYIVVRYCSTSELAPSWKKKMGTTCAS